MEKFTSYEKLAKKKQREIDAQKRATWGITNPITKKIESKKIYNRKRIRNDSAHEPFNADSFLFYI